MRGINELEESKEEQAMDAEIKTNDGSLKVLLVGVGKQKIEVIKLVVETAGLGLKEAKDLVDSVASKPQLIVRSVSFEQAAKICDSFSRAGAVAHIVPELGDPVEVKVSVPTGVTKSGCGSVVLFVLAGVWFATMVMGACLT